MPRLHAAQTLARQLEQRREFSLDVLCRRLVPRQYRNTMQATGPFMELNEHLLENSQAINLTTGNHVQGAKLRSLALESWEKMTTQRKKELLSHAETLFDADLESCKTEAESVNGAISQEADEGIDHPTCWKTAPPVHRLLDTLRDDLLRALVAWIEVDPHQPMYQRQRWGESIKGWVERLKAYFWPSPADDYQASSQRLEPLLATAARLAGKADRNLRWTSDERKESVELALGIFEWGGVLQPVPPAAETVRLVFETALRSEETPDTPLNSGWTKVAAFATAHLENQSGRHPQAIWDSRVATAITSRLDELLSRVSIGSPMSLFPNVGTVNGRGGTRPRHLSLPWPNGYGRWPSQFAGSLLIEKMRDILNESYYPSMPLADGNSGKWTVRGVEMVLFGDGY